MTQSVHMDFEIFIAQITTLMGRKEDLLPWYKNATLNLALRHIFLS